MHTIRRIFRKWSLCIIPRSRIFWIFLCQPRRDRKATQPHDHVYTYYPLLVDLGFGLSGPDYTIPVEDLFEAFTLTLIQKTRSLKVLEFVHGTSRRASLPSWVPDYSQDGSKVDYEVSTVRLAQYPLEVGRPLQMVPRLLHLIGKPMGSITTIMARMGSHTIPPSDLGLMNWSDEMLIYDRCALGSDKSMISCLESMLIECPRASLSTERSSIWVRFPPHIKDLVGSTPTLALSCLLLLVLDRKVGSENNHLLLLEDDLPPLLHAMALFLVKIHATKLLSHYSVAVN